MIKTFNQLSDEERKIYYDFVKEFGGSHYFQSYHDMVKNNLSEVFNNGDSLFSLWIDSRMMGMIGVITKEIESKGEAYIVNLTLKEKDKKHASQLVNKAISYVKSFKPDKIKLGIKSKMHYLIPVIKDERFHNHYQALLFSLDKCLVNDVESTLNFQGLSIDNHLEFKRVHNEAFHNSPNGGLLTNTQLNEMLQSNNLNEIRGVCFKDGKEIGIYELEMIDDIGWIESLAISPDMQGHGYSKSLLKYTIDLLKSKKVKNIQLIVMSTNVKAVNLYKKYGFIQKEVISDWFDIS